MANAPSRSFMIRQAVLNAVWNEYPRKLAWHGSVSTVLLALRADNPKFIPGNLVVAITREFNKLQQRYEVAA